MAKKTGLGKGLDALFMSNDVQDEENEDITVKQIKVIEIEPNTEQPRRMFNDE